MNTQRHLLLQWVTDVSQNVNSGYESCAHIAHTDKLQLYKKISEQFQTNQNKRTLFVPCQSKFTAKQYEANQGTVGMALPLLMKAL